MLHNPIQPYSKLAKLIGLSVGLSLLSPLSMAQNLFLNDMSLKSELDWLQAQGAIQISTSTWPLTANEINRALDSANIQTTEQKRIIQSVRLELHQQAPDLINTELSAYGQTKREQLPQSFADDKMADFQLGAQASYSKDDWEVNLKVNIKQDDLIDNESLSFEDSYVAGKLANQWVVAGQIPTWWGPGHEGSLIRGDASKPVVGITMQRDRQSAPSSPYLNWIGPWQYQVFAGQLDEYKAVPHTKLVGARVSVQPAPWLELGANRSIMWGGEGRPESIDSLWRAIQGTHDNQDLPDIDKPDPSNQLAGFDTRIHLNSWLNIPVSAYGQYVGEDEVGGLPSKNLYLAGLDYASALKTEKYGVVPYQLYTEWTDTRSSGEVLGVSYDHSNYTDGYYQQGYPLGYALGGDAESVTVGGKLWLDGQNFINAKLQFADVNQSSEIDTRSGISDNHAFPESDTLKVMDVAWEHQFSPKVKVSSRLWATDSDKHATDIGGGVGVEYYNF